MRKYASFLVLMKLLLLGCKQVFLDQNTISSLKFPETRQHQVIYFDKRFTVNNAGRLTVATHSLLRVGEDLKSAPELFYVFDGSVEKLIDFQAKITHATGGSTSYHENDLLFQSLSNKKIISDLKLKFLPIAEACGRGDLVEIFTLHELRLPPLGMRFSLAELHKEARNISCSIQVPAADSLQYLVKNSEISPTILMQGPSKIYQFNWPSYSPSIDDNIFEKKNRAPELLASMPRYKIDAPRRMVAIRNWQDFGDWYLELIQPQLATDEQTKQLAIAITTGKLTPRAKMDAIFDYCQKTIRYEQVYLEKGEIIPNKITTVLARKFGDCKDYAVAIYGLAQSIGLKPHLALCYRGQGFEFYPQLAVSQFNHMLVHFEDDGNHLWYDATNRIGQPGITTIDLMNQSALVLETNNSRLIPIAECSDNRLAIDGQLRYSNRGLVGELKISLYAQFAIDLVYAESYTNRAEFIKILGKWLQANINKDIILQAIDYRQEASCFVIQSRCEIPNATLEIEGAKYISLARIFNRLFPGPDQKIVANKVFYFPFYHRVDLKIKLTNLDVADGPVNQQGFLWHYDYELPAGPFDVYQQNNFCAKFETISRELHRNLKFIEREAL